MALRVAVVKNDIAQRLAGLQSLRVHFVDGVQGFQVVVKKRLALCWLACKARAA